MMIRQLQQAAAPGGSCGAARRLGPRRQLALAPPVCSGRDTFLYQLCNPAPEGHDSSADGWRHEEQMLKDYTALLDESNLLPEVRSRKAFERPRDCAKRRRKERIQRRKWERAEDFQPHSFEETALQRLESPFAAHFCANDDGEATTGLAADGLFDDAHIELWHAEEGYYQQAAAAPAYVGGYAQQQGGYASPQSWQGGYINGESATDLWQGGYMVDAPGAPAAAAGQLPPQPTEWGYVGVQPGTTMEEAAAAANAAVEAAAAEKVEAGGYYWGGQLLGSYPAQQPADAELVEAAAAGQLEVAAEEEEEGALLAQQAVLAEVVAPQEDADGVLDSAVQLLKDEAQRAAAAALARTAGHAERLAQQRSGEQGGAAGRTQQQGRRRGSAPQQGAGSRQGGSGVGAAGAK